MEAIEAVQPPQSVTAAEAGGSAIASSGHLRAEPNATTQEGDLSVDHAVPTKLRPVKACLTLKLE